MAETVDRQKREQPLLERGRDDDGEQQNGGVWQKAPQRSLSPAIDFGRRGRTSARHTPQTKNATMPTRNGGQPCEPTRIRLSGPAAKPAEMMVV